LAIPGVYVMGLIGFSIRIPAALAGILTVLSLFVLVRHLFGTKSALWTASISSSEPLAPSLQPNRIPLPFRYLPFYLSWPLEENQELPFLGDA
jgi:hypothetical protein